MSTKSNIFFYTTVASCVAVGGLTVYSIYQYLMDLNRPSKKSIKSVKPISTLNQDDIYIQNAKQRFLETFFQDESLNKQTVNYNENITPLFYDISDYKYAVLLEKNDLDLSWKQRILMQATPRGNVIMFYDVYKHGFSYYADNSVPYNVLNALAMKYVLLYRCRHFFLDEQIVPIGCTSPFVALYCKENDKQNKQFAMEQSNNLGIIPQKIDTKTGPFAKFSPKPTAEQPNNTIVIQPKKPTWNSRFLGLCKYWGLSSKKMISRSTEKLANHDIPSKKMILPTTEHVKNRMIYLGKCANFSILSRPTIEIKNQNVVKQKQISYSHFKSWQNPDTQLFS